MKALIVAAGVEPSEELFLQKFNECELKIAADNGLNIFFKYHKVPDIIIGDFDSAIEDLKDFLEKDRCTIIKLSVEKNITDTEAAIDEARTKGADEIILLGATGKRIDHLIANLMLLRGALSNKFKLIIEDEDHEIYAADGEFLIEGFKRQTISLFPIDGDACVKSVYGVYYPLENLKLKNTHSRGISNLLTEDKALIQTDKPLLIIKMKKKI